MRVLILGVNHQIQPRRILSMSTSGQVEEFERNQKEAFGGLITKIIQDRAIDLVGEEADHREEMIAAEVCRRNGCAYVNIEMSPDERAARNLPGGYRDEDSPFSEEEKERFDHEREDDMYARLRAVAVQKDSILVVCGRAHVPGLAKRFSDDGHEVSTTDLQEQVWYIENWAEHIMYNL